MNDEELTKIREQRMAQLQASQGSASSGPFKGMQGPGGDSSNKQKQQLEAQEREAELRNNLLSAILTQEARARLATLAAAKPDRAKMVENIIIQNRRMGGIRGKVDEDSLKDLLEKVNDQRQKQPKVSYERRRVFEDDDDDEDGE